MKNSQPRIDWEGIIIVGIIALVFLAVIGLLALMVLHGDGSRVTEIMK